MLKRSARPNAICGGEVRDKETNETPRWAWLRSKRAKSATSRDLPTLGETSRGQIAAFFKNFDEIFRKLPVKFPPPRH